MTNQKNKSIIRDTSIPKKPNGVPIAVEEKKKTLHNILEWFSIRAKITQCNLLCFPFRDLFFIP